MKSTDFKVAPTVCGGGTEGLIDGVGLRVTEGGEWAVRVHEGPLKDAAGVWSQFIGDVMEIMGRVGLEADHGRCFGERYLSGYEGVEEGDVSVQLLIPLRKV